MRILIAKPLFPCISLPAQFEIYRDINVLLSAFCGNCDKLSNDVHPVQFLDQLVHFGTRDPSVVASELLELVAESDLMEDGVKIGRQTYMNELLPRLWLIVL